MKRLRKRYFWFSVVFVTLDCSGEICLVFRKFQESFLLSYIPTVFQYSHNSHCCVCLIFKVPWQPPPSCP